MTLYVLQFAILMRGMLIGKNVEYVPAFEIFPIALSFLRFIYDLRYFIRMYMLHLKVDRQ